jgi:glycosyltransferase involved in cell wall biosynthesis
MATYNGSLYIEDQLDSILNQNHKDWVLFIRDDGSTDNTVEILNTYTEKEERIVVVKDRVQKNLGSCMNFSALMKFAEGKYEYYMFSDQDDVWFPDKITSSINKMLELENKYGKHYPLLVYTNFIYADEELQIVNKEIDLAPADQTDPLSLFRNLFLQNPVYGCTTLFNNSLLKKAQNLPVTFKFHDYWIAFVAASTGYAVHLSKPTLLYRQHPHNITSVLYKSRFKQRVKRALAFREIRADVLRKILQVKTIFGRFEADMSTDKKELIEGFLNKVQAGGMPVIGYMFKRQIFPRNRINRVLTMLALVKRIRYYGRRNSEFSRL